MAAAAGVLAIAAGLLLVVGDDDDPAARGDSPVNYDLPGEPAAGDPPSGMTCSVLEGARGCYDRATGTFWIKDDRDDGHHAAIYWKTTGGKASGACRNFSSLKGPWMTCEHRYALSRSPTVEFKSAVVEKRKVLEWGPEKASSTT